VGGVHRSIMVPAKLTCSSSLAVPLQQAPNRPPVAPSVQFASVSVVISLMTLPYCLTSLHASCYFYFAETGVIKHRRVPKIYFKNAKCKASSDVLCAPQD